MKNSKKLESLSSSKFEKLKENEIQNLSQIRGGKKEWTCGGSLDGYDDYDADSVDGNVTSYYYNDWYKKTIN